MKQHNQKGFTLVEILVAMTVFAIGVLGVISMQQTTFGSNSVSNALTGSTAVAAGHLELLKGLPYDDFWLEDGDDPLIPAEAPDVGENGLRNPLPRPGIFPAGSYQDQIPNPGAYSSDFQLVTGDGLYTVYWNIAEDYPVPDTKTIQVIVISTGHGPQKVVTLKTIKAEST